MCSSANITDTRYPGSDKERSSVVTAGGQQPKNSGVETRDSETERLLFGLGIGQALPGIKPELETNKENKIFGNTLLD